MKKRYYLLFAALAGMFCTHVQAQTILDEGFETSSTQSVSQPVADGWTTVNSYSGTTARFVWHNEYVENENNATITGHHCAACDAPISSNATDGNGPREEVLLTPELDLNDIYELAFTFRISPMNYKDGPVYDLQVRVVEDDNLADAETVFSIQNEKMMRECDVMDYPITTWNPRTPKVYLGDWKGKKVKLAFVYKMLTDYANVVWLDDVKVYRVEEDVTPRPVLNADSYKFPDMYIGEKFYSEVFTMTNKGKNGLKVESIDLPQGVSISLDPTTVNLNKYESVSFQLAYTASLTSPASSTVVLHTNGGDVKIALSTTKLELPDGMTLENFEGYFPPAGWKNNGWGAVNTSIEGDQCVYTGAEFSNVYLTSPRLDLSQGGDFTFTYYNRYDGDEEGYLQSNDFYVQVSYDGGNSWKTVWTFDYNLGDYTETLTVPLGTGTDDSYVRFVNTGVSSEDGEIDPYSSIYIDRVLLPHVYGIDGLPLSVTMISPKNGAQSVYPQDIVLNWGPAQFAEGYKVYAGSNAEVNDLVNGVDVGDALTYTIPQAPYETTINWKIIPYNSVGDAIAANVPVWSFTTQPDASVMEFPYKENFDGCTNAQPVPTGWLSVTTHDAAFAKWSPNNIYPYGGKGVSLAAGWLNAGETSTLTSAPFRLPADGKSMSISFDWANGHPSDLVIDETGLLEKQNVAGGNGKDEVVFEIFCDGVWKQASYLSENADEDGKNYWRHETIDLNEYAGKTVQFRWIARAFVTYFGYGTLDNVVIDGTVESGVMFNKEGWDALKVNYQKAVNSGDIFTMKNNGKQKETVKNVSFGTNDFQSSIAAGDALEVGQGMPFNLTFTANNAAQVVEDEMTIEFESGLTVTFPVRGEGMAEDVLYYGFEPNPLDYEWNVDFTQIDVDRKVNYMPNYHLTLFENEGGRFAFTACTNNNIDNLPAHSGTHTIAAFAPDDNSAADDWLISKQIIPQAGATFDFYARNLGTTGSVFIGDNDLHSVTVLVSEDGNTKTSDFKVVMKAVEMPYLDGNEYNHYTADLSAYEGKPVYVALRHTTVSANWFALFDDFTFTHVGDATNAIQEVNTEIDGNARVSVFNANGVLVSEGIGQGAMQSLNRGLYIVKVQEGDSVKTFRVTKK